MDEKKAKFNSIEDESENFFTLSADELYVELDKLPKVSSNSWGAKNAILPTIDQD